MENEGFLSSERKCDLLGLLTLVITAMLFLALATDGFEATQNSGRPIDGMLNVPNTLGRPGAFFAGVFAFLFGDASHLIYAITFIWALKLCIHRPVGRLMTRLLGVVLLVSAAAGLLHMNVDQGFSNPQAGGALGAFVAERMLLPHFAWIGSNVIAGIMGLVGMLLATDFVFIHFVIGIHRLVTLSFRSVWRLFRFVFQTIGAALQFVWHGILWFLGEAPAKPRKIPEDAYQPISDFCEQIPESAFPPAPKVKKRGGMTAFIFGLLIPRVTHKPLGTETAQEADEPPMPEIEVIAADLPQPGQAPVTQHQPLRVHSSLLEEQDDLDTESPFCKIPELDIIGAAPVPPKSDKKALPAEDDLFPQETLAAAQKQTDNNKLDEQDNRSSLRVDAVAAKAVNPKKGVPRLKRRPTQADELPEDYEYPAKYTPPPLDLFALAERRIIPNLREKLGQMASRLEDTLRTFNLEATVTDVTRGPTITRFELEPAPGMKVSRFLSLTDDIALALKAKGVRVEAPIPGKGRVGIEISNEERDPVVIRELLEHPTFSKHGFGLDLALGKDIAGDVCIADLMRMPHLLVAGATGAGKTVCIKALLASLLFHHTPDELQLMLIDPKMVELSIFNDIPHLITPVVTDPKKASASLQWLITEMEERYRLFADLRVRNIEVYNNSVENGEIEMEGVEGSRKSHSVNVVRKLPFIVCVIDELADLMMLARAEVEESIMRLAQLARAVGIHLIIATQRPSVDVLTGVIKANFPARISFQVSSRVDSRCILDEIGAERLVGMGDMLYLPAGQSKPARIQGAFVSDREMLDLIAYLKRQAPPQYRDEIANYGKSKDSITDMEHEEDPLLEDAVRVVLETKQASISMVQRRLRVGYTRAARLIDMMELKGIVGPHTGSKAREILIDSSGSRDYVERPYSDDDEYPEDSDDLEESEDPSQEDD